MKEVPGAQLGWLENSGSKSMWKLRESSTDERRLAYIFIAQGSHSVVTLKHCTCLLRSGVHADRPVDHVRNAEA